MFQEDTVVSSDISLFTDASNIGMGGVFEDEWFSVEWPSHIAGDQCSTNFQEMFAILTAVTIWGGKLKNKQILIYCDNETAVSIINSGTCKSSKMMIIVRKIFFVCAEHNISIFSEHIPGYSNELADSLSRLQVERFTHLHPTASATPVVVPTTIWNI